jgi:carbon-monoxide dehydrogenase medium subunit
MQEFTYHAPGTLPEALALLAQHGPAATCLAGGTDLLLAMERGRRHPAHVVDLKRIAELRGIAPLPGGGHRLGALTAMVDIEAHDALRAAYPALAEAASFVGGPAIRNRATLGGNVCNASPAADTATPLVALGAKAEIVGAAGVRTLPLEQLWRGAGGIALEPGELLSAVRIPGGAGRRGNAFQRLTRTAMDIAVVNVAAVVALDGAGRVAHLAVALGAVGPTVLLVPDAGRDSVGAPLTDARVERIAQLAQAAARPRDDVRASAAYRADQCAVLVRRALRAAADRALGSAEGRP